MGGSWEVVPLKWYDSAYYNEECMHRLYVIINVLIYCWFRKTPNGLIGAVCNLLLLSGSFDFEKFQNWFHACLSKPRQNKNQHLFLTPICLRCCSSETFILVSNTINMLWRCPAQYVTFFYTGYHLSKLQSCILIFSTKFYLFPYLNIAPQNLVI